MVNSAPFLLQCCRCRAPHRRSILISFFFYFVIPLLLLRLSRLLFWLDVLLLIRMRASLTSLLVCPPGVLPVCPHKRKAVGPSKVAAKKKKKAEMAMSGVDGSMLAGASASALSCHVEHNCHFFSVSFRCAEFSFRSSMHAFKCAATAATKNRVHKHMRAYLCLTALAEEGVGERRR